MRAKTTSLAATLLLCFSLGKATAAGTPSFGPPVIYSVGTRPTFILPGDFDGDGNMDLLIAQDGDPNVAADGSLKILLGTGDGSLKPAATVAANLSLNSVAVADVNGDHRLDIVFAVHGDSSSSQNGSITVLPGNGDGTFGNPKTFQLQGDTFSLAVGDFNSDMYPDLVVLVSSGTSKLTLFPGNGDATFGSPTDILDNIEPFPISLSGISSILVADFDGDNKPDLVVGLVKRLIVVRGNGDGTFQPAIDAPGYQGIFFVEPLPVAAADFNRDGVLDLLVWAWSSGEGGNTVRAQTLLGNGDGTLQAPVTVATDTQGLFPAVGDFNGDGHPDFAITDAFLSQVNVHLGNGDGTFGSALSFSTVTYPFSVSAVDLTSDHAPELVTANGFDSAIVVQLNNSGSDFSISASPINPGIVPRGQSASSTISLAHLNAFDDSVALTCSVQPAQSAPTCAFNPSSITFDGTGNATATLTMNTGAATASLVPPSLPHNSGPLQFLWLPIAGFTLIGAGLGSGRSPRRRPIIYLLGVALFSGVIFQAACGGGGTGPRSQTYTITVTGRSEATQHSTTVTLTVE